MIHDLVEKGHLQFRFFFAFDSVLWKGSSIVCRIERTVKRDGERWKQEALKLNRWSCANPPTLVSCMMAHDAPHERRVFMTRFLWVPPPPHARSWSMVWSCPLLFPLTVCGTRGPVLTPCAPDSCGTHV